MFSEVKGYFKRKRMIVRFFKLSKEQKFTRLNGDTITGKVLTKLSDDRAVDEDGNLVEVLASEQVFKLKNKHKSLSK